MIKPDPHVLAFGDSLTAGYGLAREMAFPAQLERALQARRPGAVVENAGVSGDTSADGRRRLPRVLSRLTRKPDLAIVELGANDFLRGFAPERTRADLDWILGEFDRIGVPVLLAGMAAPTFLGGWAQRFNVIHPELAAKHRVPLYPHFLAGVAGQRGLTLADGVHPNARAIGIVTERILPHVERALDANERAAA